MFSPCSWLIRQSYARILGKLRTRSRRRRYQSSPTFVSMSNAVRPRPREEQWELWFCRNDRGGSTSPTCQTERGTTSWTCPLSRRGFLVPRWPRCNSLRHLNCRNSNPPHLPCPVGPAGPRNPRHRLQLRWHCPRKLPRPGRRREPPDRTSLHR